MAKLTDSQLIVLSAAAARDDGIAVVPAKMNRAAASKVGSSLVARKLMREVKAKPGMPVWREGADGRPISLIITAAGSNAIGVDETGSADEVRAVRSKRASKRLGAVGKEAGRGTARLKVQRRPTATRRLEAGVGD